MNEAKGQCKHGTFILTEGCPQCIAEAVNQRREQEKNTGNAPPSVASTTGDPPSIPFAIGEPTKTALVPGPGIDTDVERFFAEAVKLKDYAEARTITTAEDAKAATDDLAIISKLKKAMQAKKDEYLRPLKEEVQAMSDLYKSLMEPVEVANQLTRSKLIHYQAEQERIRREQEDINRKRREAAEQEARLKGTPVEPVDTVAVSPEAPKRVSTEIGTAGQRANWKWEVIDINLVPREYLVVDSAQLTAIARKHHDQKPIPGIRFYNEPGIHVTAR